MTPCDQERLSEKLQLLDHFQYTDLGLPFQGSGSHSNKYEREGVTGPEIRALDTIAVLLTTGERGDVTAVAMESDTELRLVLAKNWHPTHRDNAAVQNLILLLTDPAINHSAQIFPSIITYCEQNINNRLKRLNKSIIAFMPLASSALQQHTPGSINGEFPESEDYRNFAYPNRTPRFVDMAVDLLSSCRDHSSHDLNLLDINTTVQNFVKLSVEAKTLSRARFLNEYIHDSRFLVRQQMATKLKRHLLKVCQYSFGTQDLITKAKRWFPNGEIRYRWVDLSAVLPDHGEKPEIEITRSFAKTLLQHDRDPDSISVIESKHPKLFTNPWTYQINPCIHAEIRIILDLDPPANIARQTQQRPIGCSKRSCLCCEVWIQAFNRTFDTNWMTSGSHGKPYPNWALPGVAYAARNDGTSSIDEDVCRKVDSRLEDVFAWLCLMPRVSDEHHSSGEGTNEESAVATRQLLQFLSGAQS
jgi:hypothetical protein